MNRRLHSPVTALVSAMLLATAGVAAAHGDGTASTPVRPAAPVVMSATEERGPSGQLQASGNGNVAIAGRLTITANLPRRVVLRITDRGGDGVVHVAGEQVRLRNGKGAVRAAGIVYAAGTNLTLQFTGNGIELLAAGVGRATFRGTGRYRLNMSAERAWPRNAAVQLAPARSATPSSRTRVRPIAARR